MKTLITIILLMVCSCFTRYEDDTDIKCWLDGEYKKQQIEIEIILKKLNSSFKEIEKIKKQNEQRN